MLTRNFRRQPNFCRISLCSPVKFLAVRIFSIGYYEKLYRYKRVILLVCFINCFRICSIGYYEKLYRYKRVVMLVCFYKLFHRQMHQMPPPPPHPWVQHWCKLKFSQGLLTLPSLITWLKKAFECDANPHFRRQPNFCRIFLYSSVKFLAVRIFSIGYYEKLYRYKRVVMLVCFYKLFHRQMHQTTI